MGCIWQAYDQRNLLVGIVFCYPIMHYIWYVSEKVYKIYNDCFPFNTFSVEQIYRNRKPWLTKHSTPYRRRTLLWYQISSSSQNMTSFTFLCLPILGRHVAFASIASGYTICQELLV